MLAATANNIATAREIFSVRSNFWFSKAVARMPPDKSHTIYNNRNKQDDRAGGRDTEPVRFKKRQKRRHDRATRGDQGANAGGGHDCDDREAVCTKFKSDRRFILSLFCAWRTKNFVRGRDS